MFDGIFELFAQTLSFFYDLIPNYAIAIVLLTLLVMVITTPFTLKGTRSMIQMQRLQPEMRRLQLKYKDDRQKLNEELMAFYKENNLNPLGGCLPLLLQTPIFIILFNVIQGLTYIPAGADDLRPEVPRPHLGAVPEPRRRHRDDVVRGRPRGERQHGAERGLRRRAPPRRHGGDRGGHLLLPAEADPGPQPERRDPAAAEDDHAADAGDVRVLRLRVPVGAGRLLHHVEPVPDRHAGLHHPNPLPR